jgi:hypothetical protein
MALALYARDLDQYRLVEHGRSAQQRPGDRDLVLMREPSDQPARRIGEPRQPFGQIGARGDLGVRNQAGQDAVEEIDMIGVEIPRALQKQFAEPARGLGAALWIADLTISSSSGISAVTVDINLPEPAALAGFRAI